LGLCAVLNYAFRKWWSPLDEIMNNLSDEIVKNLANKCANEIVGSNVGAMKSPGRPLCVVIPAKLSNEIETLPRALMQFLPEHQGGNGIRLPQGALIVVVYNPGPENECERNCLNQCQMIGSAVPGASYVSVCSPDAACKADNLNDAFVFLKEQSEHVSEFVCMMDADVRFQHPYSVELAILSLRDSGPEVAVVTGRQIIEKGHWLVAAEYQAKNIVSLGRGVFLGCGGWLTGSCIFQRYDVAATHTWDRECLTEDNDMMMRLAAEGFQCQNNMDLHVLAEAPPDCMPFLAQRTRWAQGQAWITAIRLPQLIRQAVLQQNTPLPRRLWLTLRWILFWFGRSLSAYVVPLGLPCALAFQLRCGLDIFGEHSAVCEDAQNMFRCWRHMFLTYSAVNFAVLLAAASFQHPWLRWYHFVLDAFVRIPYEIFNAQASIIAHAQFILGLNRWIVTDRQKRG